MGLNPNESNLPGDRADVDSDADARIGNHKNTTFSLSHLYELLGPTITLSLTSAALYVLSYIYYASFCQRLALPYKGLDIPVAFYLPDIIFLLCILILIFVFYRIVIYYLSPFFNKGITINIGFNTTLILIMFLLLFSDINEIVLPSILSLLILDQILTTLMTIIIYSYIYPKVFLILLGIVFFLLLGYLMERFYSFVMMRLSSQSLKSEVTEIFNFVSEVNLFSLLGTFIIAMLLSYSMGQYNAEQLIDGKRGEIETTIITEGKNIETNNKSFILMMIRDGNYYLLDRKNSTTKNVSMYIIPSNRILFAKTNGTII